jgi:hypothetical protein
MHVSGSFYIYLRTVHIAQRSMQRQGGGVEKTGDTELDHRAGRVDFDD